GAERAIDETFDAADAYPVVAEVRFDAEVRQAAPISQRPAQVDARGQLALVGELLIETEQAAARGRVAAVHVLNTGDADPPRLGLGGADALDDLFLRRPRDVLFDQVHSVVAQHAARLAGAGLAVDDAAGRVGRLRGDAGQTEDPAVDHGHVPVVAA